MTTAAPWRAEYGGLVIDYSAFTNNDDRNLALLAVAERENLLAHVGTLDGEHDTYYVVLCNGQRLLLTSTEVPSFVLALFVAAGRDIAPVAYRTGLSHSAHNARLQ